MEELFAEDVEDQLGILKKRIEKARGNLASHKIREEERIAEMEKEYHMLGVLRGKLEVKQPELIEAVKDVQDARRKK